MTHEKKQGQNQIEFQKIIERKNAAFADELIKRPFPVEKISILWKEKALKALEFASPHSLGINANEFMILIAKVPCSPDYALSFFQFATLSNNLEMRSARDLEFNSLVRYGTLMTECMQHVQYYSDEITKMKEEIDRRIEEEETMKRTAAGNRGGLSPVKAEA